MNFISSIINLVVPRLWDPMVRQFNYLLNHESNVRSLTKAMDELRARNDDIKDKILIEERQQRKRTHEVEVWLKSVEGIEDEATKIQNDFEQMARCLGGSSLNCWSSYRIGKRAFKKHVDVVELHGKGCFDPLTMEAPPRLVQDIPIPFPVRSMESNLQMVLSYIRDDGTDIIGIYGMGGVGKTTLLKSTNNEFLPRPGTISQFDHVVWAVVSKEFNLERLQKNIAKSLGLMLEGDATSLANNIAGFLNDKNFLVLLDDLWEAVDLEDVGIPLPLATIGEHKRKVVFTTRSVQVFGRMRARRKVKVDCLKPEEAWCLFQENVGEEVFQSSGGIQTIAEKVAAECDGLPLALITIGRAMSTKRSLEEWQYALEMLEKSRPSKIPGMEENTMSLYPRLKFSYDNLENDIIKHCFLSCSLWPEDYNIKKTELIECWMGLGLIDEFDNLGEAYGRGHSLIGVLEAACLLETGADNRREVKLHDVIRDMALWITSECDDKNRWMVLPGIGLMQAPEEAEKWRLVKRASLMLNKIETLPERPMDCPNLLSLMLQENYYLSEIPNGFFKSMSVLTYLDLSHTEIRELPKEIGGMVELQYLNLTYTPIVSIPDELRNLEKLKYFFLGETYELRTIPEGVISSLSMLLVLDLLQSAYAGWEVEGGGSGYRELESLRRSLKALGITIRTMSALERLSMLSRVSIWRLWLSGISGITSLNLLSPTYLGNQNMRRSLQLLRIEACSNLEVLMMDGGNERPLVQDFSLERLEVLELWSLKEWKTIIWRGLAPGKLLPALRQLTINDCSKLKNVTWVLQLTCLENLTLSWCREMEVVIGEEEDGGSGGTSFPCLRTLLLSNLPRLGSICGRALAFPYLESIEVVRCPMLKKLQVGRETTKLREIWGWTGWWEALAWEDDSIKTHLLPYFKGSFKGHHQ